MKQKTVTLPSGLECRIRPLGVLGRNTLENLDRDTAGAENGEAQSLARRLLQVTLQTIEPRMSLQRDQEKAQFVDDVLDQEDFEALLAECLAVEAEAAARLPLAQTTRSSVASG